MSRRTTSLRRFGGGSNRVARARAGSRKSLPQRKLDTSNRLIAPPHTLILPSLRGIKTVYESSYGFQAALSPALTLMKRGQLSGKHLAEADSVVSALDHALRDVIDNATTPTDKDVFDIEIRLTDTHGYPASSNSGYLFFSWGNTASTQYIPLQPFYDQLHDNPYQDRLMASLYHWVYQTACRVFFGFGFENAKALFTYRYELYKREQDAGEDVDLEGEVEFADLSAVMGYIRNHRKLRLKRHEVDKAISSILPNDVRGAFIKAHSMFNLSRTIHIPQMTAECRNVFEDATYYEGDPVPAIGISHCRDDAVVSWLDDYCDDQFNSGVNCEAPVMRCFRMDDQITFGRLIAALPRMVRTAFALSEWFSIAEKMENAASH
jgi:hypothetical protein